MLRNTHWKLKILDYRDTDRDLQYSNHIAALIEMKGFLHGKGQTGVFFSPERNEPNGYLNSLGEFQLYHAEQLFLQRHIPKLFECYTEHNGKISVEKTIQEFSVFLDGLVITDVIGDPFNGNSSKRNTFLRNRLMMLEWIKKRRIRESLL